MQHLIDTTDFSDAQIKQIIQDAKSFKNNYPPKLLHNKLLITLFFEASTRTRSSFEVAAKRLGASVVHLDPSRSSTKKGETLHDTFANLCAMDPDGVIIRHSQNETPSQLANLNLTPVINAGAGNYAHPTQALLDLFTIYEHFDGNIAGKKVAIVGDIANSRVASSDIRLFSRMGLDVHLVANQELLPQTTLPTHQNLSEIIDDIDIIISLRAQIERHQNSDNDYSKFASYCITKELMGNRDILLMHPGPVIRNIDISDEMLEDARCKVLTQVNNGVFVRMAILKLLLLDS
jgi:aspartate carbamoyltransferase catalytic subunit